VTVESFGRSMAVKARGTMLCYEHAGRHMIAQCRGRRIIGRSSRSNTNTTPNIIPAYSATEFAVRGLMQAAGTSFYRTRCFALIG
ncbi:hypothetical protein EDB86DRAFT_2798536, partial [Lactarius hatsudake]